MEDFVPFELAKKLKEKEFRSKCYNHYYEDTKGVFLSAFPRCYNYGSNEVDVPTISQVLKWLREEKNIHLIVEIADSGWYFTLYPNVRWENDVLKSDKYIMSFKNKSSYEQAALAGIDYVLNNLI